MDNFDGNKLLGILQQAQNSAKLADASVWPVTLSSRDLLHLISLLEPPPKVRYRMSLLWQVVVNQCGEWRTHQETFDAVSDEDAKSHARERVARSHLDQIRVDSLLRIDQEEKTTQIVL